MDPPVRKFTGNDSVGEPEETDHITMAVQAFAHFTVVYSGSNIVLCDLQGTSEALSDLITFISGV